VCVRVGVCVCVCVCVGVCVRNGLRGMRCFGFRIYGLGVRV